MQDDNWAFRSRLWDKLLVAQCSLLLFLAAPAIAAGGNTCGDWIGPDGFSCAIFKTQDECDVRARMIALMNEKGPTTPETAAEGLQIERATAERALENLVRERRAERKSAAQPALAIAEIIPSQLADPNIKIYTLHTTHTPAKYQ